MSDWNSVKSRNNLGIRLRSKSDTFIHWCWSNSTNPDSCWKVRVSEGVKDGWLLKQLLIIIIFQTHNKRLLVFLKWTEELSGSYLRIQFGRVSAQLGSVAGGREREWEWLEWIISPLFTLLVLMLSPHVCLTDLHYSLSLWSRLTFALAVFQLPGGTAADLAWCFMEPLIIYFNINPAYIHAKHSSSIFTEMQRLKHIFRHPEHKKPHW